MINFLKKDVLILIRDKSELITLLLMPFILIGILGFALKGLLDGNVEGLHMPIAVVQEDDEEASMDKFVETLKHLNLPNEEIQYLQNIATEINPIHLLNDMLSDDELKKIIEANHMDKKEAEEALENGEIAVILTIPEQFSYHAYKKMILNEGNGASFEVMTNDTEAFYFQLFSDIMDSFINSVNFETAIATSFGGEIPEARSSIGDIETMTKRDPVNSFQYYTIGMAVMFVLMIGGSIAAKAFVEKKQHVFDRIVLSGSPPISYLTGKAISATIVSFLQLSILFLLSSLIFQAFKITDASFWIGMAFITLILSICVGSIASFITALSLYYNNEAIAAIFSGGIVSIFAFVGGSFFPLDGMPSFLVTIGSWTPNGAAFTAYLQWIQGYEMSAIILPLARVFIISLLLYILSLTIFSKRRFVS